jgi:hypothetical protein
MKRLAVCLLACGCARDPFGILDRLRTRNTDEPTIPALPPPYVEACLRPDASEGLCATVDATVSGGQARIVFTAPPSVDYEAHDSVIEAALGSVIPTPHGPARVVELVENPGAARLQYFELGMDASNLLFIGPSTPSHLGGRGVYHGGTMEDESWLVFFNEPEPIHVKKGDAVRTPTGSFRVVDIGPRFVTLDTRFGGAP